jgi:acyl-CoA synthetase (AMP-forming)/AMP-acid ligase II
MTEVTTIPRVTRVAAERFGSRTAIQDGDVALTFAELAESMLTVSRALIGHGLDPGDRVAIWAPNSHYWIRAALGVLAAGAVVVPINTRYRGTEARDLLRRTQAKSIFVDQSFLNYDYVGALLEPPDETEEAEEALPDLQWVVNLADPNLPRPRTARTGPDVISWDAFLAAGEEIPRTLAVAVAEAVQPGDLAELIFTSGTTGRSKGVMLPHGPGTILYRDFGEIWGVREGDRYLITLPMFHAGGNKAGMLLCLIHGVTMVPMAVFDAETAMRVIERERITVMNGPPTIYFSILDHPGRPAFDLSSLRLASTGAAVVPASLVERVRHELPFRHVITAYGMTESCGTATMCRMGDSAETITTTNGSPLPQVSLKIVDPTGVALPAGEPGEVLIKGGNVTPGYWQEPGLTREAIDDDGWLHSGDIGELDPQGNLKITDRLKDLFFVGGFTVSPAEIEQTLIRHPQIQDVSVIGVPDDRLGEVARAYVVRPPATQVQEQDIIAWCRERLANFKVPRSVVFVPVLPRNASGKVTKFDLRQS